MRKSVGFPDSIEFTGLKSSKTTTRKRASRPSPQKRKSKKAVEESSLGFLDFGRPRFLIFYILVLLMVSLRIAFMDGGVRQFFELQDRIAMLDNQIKETVDENQRLELEIKKIKNDRRYQQQMARKHLGVIAPDEYLVQFLED